VSRRTLTDDPLDLALLRVSSGFVILSFVATILAWIHLLIAPILWGLVIALVISGFVFGKSDLKVTLNALLKTWNRARALPLNAILTAVVALALLMDLLLTFVPTTAWDSLTYHYTLPALWLKARGFVALPGNCYSELPCGSEMIFAIAFALGGLKPDHTGAGALAANHLTWLAGFFSCIAFISISRKLGSAKSEGGAKAPLWDQWTPGLIAAIAFLSLPIVYVEEMEGGYIENFLVFYTLALLIALLAYKENGEIGLIPIIGILAGGQLASKHTGIFIDILVLIILVVWIIRSKANASAWLKLLLAAMISVIIPLPWYLKSLMNTGDPAYPFLTHVLHPQTLLPDIMYWSNPNVERSLWGFITYTWRLSWDVSLTQFDFRLLTWFFLPLLPFAVVWSIAPPRARVVGLVTWVQILLIYIFAPGEPRYMLAAWGLYAALGAWALMVLSEKAKSFSAIVLPVILLIPVAFSLVSRTGEINKRVPTIIGAATVGTYFNESLDIEPLIDYINTETPPDSGVVMVEPRVLYIQRPYETWYPFPTAPTADWPYLEPDELASFWLRDGMRYVVITYGPNYRALTLNYLDILSRGESSYGADFFFNLPDWVLKRASYAESVLSIQDGSELEIENNWKSIRESDNFDIHSIRRLMTLEQMGLIEPVYVDPRAGVVFRIMQGEDER
jgi:4-amino-4-deoxy-L-arabinose transferase-like glycosyltransferase